MIWLLLACSSDKNIDEITAAEQQMEVISRSFHESM